MEAEKQYRHAVKCDPKHGMAQYNLGWVLEKVRGARDAEIFRFFGRGIAIF